MYHHPFGVRRLAAAFTAPASLANCHPACPPQEGPERPDFLFRAAFRRVGPRSGGIAAPSLRLAYFRFSIFDFRFSSLLPNLKLKTENSFPLVLPYFCAFRRLP
jgi:hypothetical protein